MFLPRNTNKKYSQRSTYYWVNNILGKTACYTEILIIKRMKKKGNLLFKCETLNVREYQRYLALVFPYRVDKTLIISKINVIELTIKAH